MWVTLAVVMVLAIAGGWYYFSKNKISNSNNSNQIVSNTNLNINILGNSNTNAVANNNLNTNQLNVNNDEAYWNTYWDNLVSKAKQESSLKIVDDFSFQIPKTLIDRSLSGIVSYVFDDQQEGPTISIQGVTEQPAVIMSSIKSGLSQYEKVVLEKKETINGIEWSMIEQTTDFGIDQVVWVARGRTSTVKVSYTVTRPGTTGVFEGIVKSARLK